MDNFLNELTNPALWAGVVLSFAIQRVFKVLPALWTGFRRSAKARHLTWLKNRRHSQDEVTYQSIKASAYFLLFCGSFAVFVLLALTSELASNLEAFSVLFFVVLSPVLVVEVIWLLHKARAEALIQARRRFISKRNLRINRNMAEG